ncbi:MAG TPA: hypothetical protein VNG33_23685, partial [Polyangiaceae bacterium]|nr:hypothetical protein [Polyangiaceae bacterium]
MDELHRRSSAHRSAQRLLAEVAALGGATAPSAQEIPKLIELRQTQLGEIDAQRLTRERALTLAAEQSREWQTALGLLAALGRTTEAEGAYHAARDALRELDSLEHGLFERPALLAQLSEHQRLAERQTAAQKAAHALGLAQGGDSLARIEARLSSADTDLERLEEQRRALEEQRRQVSADRGLTRERLAQAQASLGKHRRVLQRVERITASAGPFAPTQEAVLRLRDSLSGERQELASALESATQKREQLLHDANHLEASGGQFSAELLKLRDELDGELLGNRFEELDAKAAARLEALLGPLTHAIVVDDVAEASQRLEGKPRELLEVRLLASGTDLGALDQNASEHALDLFVSEGPALRITRRPERPTLGRKAREARVEELRREAATLGEELERRQARLRSVTQALTEIDQLLPDAELLERGDPAQAQSLLQVEQQKLEQDEQALDQAITELAVRISDTRLDAGRCRALLSEAFLLDADSHADQARTLGEQLARLEQAASELARLAKPRKELTALLDALRALPPTAEELSRFETERAELAAERDRTFSLLEALTRLQGQLPALDWGDAEHALQNGEQVAPALEEQHQRARAAVEAAEEQVQAADTAWEHATADLQRAEAALGALEAHAARLAQELASLGLTAEQTPERVAAQLSELGALVERLTLEERDLLAKRGAQAERLRQLGLELGKIQRDLADAQAAAEPAEQRWQALRDHAQAAQVLHSGEVSDDDEQRSALELRAEARSRAELLRDRLSAARGGDSLARAVPEPSPDDDDGFLALWLRVREWLSRRVPAQVAQVEDPLLALERLRGHLSVLEQRLSHQEADLRGASEDVARGIEVQLRRAKAQVRRLNQNLDGVS